MNELELIAELRKTQAQLEQALKVVEAARGYLFCPVEEDENGGFRFSPVGRDRLLKAYRKFIAEGAVREKV